MASLGSLAKLAGKAILKKAPIIGTAASLLWPTALAADEEYLKNDYLNSNASNNNVQFAPEDDYFQDASTDKQWNENMSSKDTSYSGNPRKDAIASQYDKAYGVLKDTLDDNFGFSKKDEDKMYSKINSIASSLKGGLNTYKTAQMSALDKSYQDVMSDQKSNLKDIYNTVQTGMKQGNDYLGLKGAADSSASQMYARGLMGEAAKGRRSVLEEARGQYAEIETKRKQADQYAALEESKIDRQSQQRIDAVKTDYAKKRSALAKLAANADDYEREDIENENGKNLQEAYNKIAQIEAAANGWKNELATWKNDMYTRLDTLKSELISLTQFTPEEITMPEIDTGIEDTSMDTEEETTQTFNKRKSLQDFLDNPSGEWLNSY